MKIPPVMGFGSPNGPWSIAEIELILASARSMPGDVAGIPSGHWWPAFLLVLLDTGTQPAQLLRLHRAAYDDAVGDLAIGTRLFRLHVLATNALRQILPHDSAKVFPWTLDRDRPSGKFEMLGLHYKRLLFRANLPIVTANLFPRLLMTAQGQPELLDRLTLAIPFRPREGGFTLRRLRAKPKDQRAASVDRTPKARREMNRTIIRITIDPARTLRHFFESSYCPLRLADKKQSSADDYRFTIGKFAAFLGCDPTPANLNDDCLERFMAWLKKRGLANVTINGHRSRLLALWRYAWRKRLLNELPRDVPKYSEPKRIPEAWSIEEFTRILEAAEQTQGSICGIAAGHWWTALLLVLYETGLRINAALQIERSKLNVESRWLTVPAEDQKQNCEQTFRLHPDTIAAILRMPVQTDQLFPWPYETKQVGIHYRKILKRTGLPCGRRDQLHKIRRTSGTAVANVADERAAQAHLGHSSLSLTKRFYLDPRKIRNSQAAAELIERPGWKFAGDDRDTAAGLALPRRWDARGVRHNAGEINLVSEGCGSWRRFRLTTRHWMPRSASTSKNMRG